MNYRDHDRPKGDLELCKDVYYDLCDLEGRVNKNSIHQYDLADALKFNKHTMLNIVEVVEDAKISLKLMRLEAKIRKFLRG
jgi:hypothetical protein